MEEIVAVVRDADAEAVYPGANDAAIDSLRRRVRDELGAKLPQAYAKFLGITDGLEFDGVVLYSTVQNEERRGLIETNEAWRDAPGNAGLLVLADTDTDILTVDSEGRDPARRDRITGEVTERYGSIGAMIETALRTRL